MPSGVRLASDSPRAAASRIRAKGCTASPYSAASLPKSAAGHADLCCAQFNPPNPHSFPSCLTAMKDMQPAGFALPLGRFDPRADGSIGIVGDFLCTSTNPGRLEIGQGRRLFTRCQVDDGLLMTLPLSILGQPGGKLQAR